MVNSDASSPSVGSSNFVWQPKKALLGLVEVGINLLMRDIMISANNEGQMFSKLMEVLENEAYGMSTIVGPKVLQTASFKCWICHFQ
jgi:hypothetical protein